jgi:hypothetical protein
MNKDSGVLIGLGESLVCLDPRFANRHGLIAGATGTGKTVTLLVRGLLGSLFKGR